MVETLIQCGADVNTTDKYGRTALFYAVKKENETIAKKLIECGADINAIDKDGDTALFHAVQKENKTMVKKLFECDAVINASDDDVKTALFYAVQKENEKMVAILIDCGAHVNATDEDGKTALFHAVQVENEEIVAILIDCGADVNATDKSGATALFYAVGKGNENMLENLIKCGADINATDKDGETALFRAVENENTTIVEKLIKSDANINIKNKCGETALFHAAEKEIEPIVDILIKFGADVKSRAQNGATALFSAVEKENKKMVVRLIKSQADINATDKYKKSALFYAVEKENENMVETLIDLGANVNATDGYGRTALFSAVDKDNRKMVEKLIKLGADVNATNMYGKTALFCAEGNKDGKTLEKLIKCSADVNIRDKNGMTVFFCAVTIGNKIMVETLSKAGANINVTDDDGKTALFHAVQKENEEMVAILIDCGADVNATDDDGKTALFHAVQKENEEMVLILIDCGADVNVIDGDGKTALSYAVERENETIVKNLFECRARINASDGDRKTALFHAVRKENEEMFEKLIKCGADINATDEDGKTALFYAVEKNNENMVRTLIDREYGADINTTDKYGKTALFFLNSKNFFVVAQMLIKDGDDEAVNVRDHYGRTPLFYAITQSVSLARYLLDKRATLCLDENCSVLTFLIEKKCFSSLSGSPNLRDGLNLLAECKEVERNTIFKAILSVAFCRILYMKPGSCDIDVDSFSKLMSLAKENASDFKFFQVKFPVGKCKTVSEISTMLHKECHDKPLIESRAVLEVIQLLIQLGAKPNTTDSDGNTALHHATQLAFHGVTQKSVIEIIQQLKNLEVPFDIANHQNETPLLYCLSKTIEKVTREEKPWPAVKRQAAVCRFLVECGSSVKVKTASGETVLHLTIKLLQQGFLKRNSELRKDISDATLELMKVFVNVDKRQEVGINSQDKDGNTPLHLWAKLQLPPGEDYSSTDEEHTFQELLNMIFDNYFRENRALLNAKDENGETPLHLCRTWTAVGLLLDAGANPNVVDSAGCTPLHFAARNNESVRNQGSLYPDILLAPNEFWKTALIKDLDPWTADKDGDSVLSVLLKYNSHDHVKSLVDVAVDQDSPANSLVLFSLLTSVCEDKSPNAQWKKDAAETILSSTRCPVNGNDNENSPLHFCFRNIVEVSKDLTVDQIKTTVHWNLAKLLRARGADYRIPDVTGKTCLEIATECSPLKELLKVPIDLHKFPENIKTWKSVSRSHQRYLQKVVRHIESKHVESFWYYKDHLARGSFGAVFAGINEKDGREVAIKRIETIRMPRQEAKREITILTALADCEQVVRYLSFFEDEQFSYIILELTEGNLDELLGHTIAVNNRVQLCQDVVMGLKFLHGHSILHRDLKPTNILYKWHPKLCLKIADFGLSRLIDSACTTVYGTNAGTRCWIAPEVLKIKKKEKGHSKSSDVFACGLVLHYILSIKKHPFTPVDSVNKGEMQIDHETETNVLKGNMEGWDDSVCPEAAHLLKLLLNGDESKRPSADKALDHPFFWSKEKKMNLLTAVGNQPEIECPRAKVSSMTAVENDLEASFGTIVKHGQWNDRGYAHMPAIYAEMTTKGRKMRYDSFSTVDLVRFIRNADAHVSERTRPPPIRKLLLEDFVFLEYFPDLVMEVYKAVTTHGWDQSREEIKCKLSV